MNENLITALEAAWELDPVRLENKLWTLIANSKEVCYTSDVLKTDVEEMSNKTQRMA